MARLSFQSRAPRRAASLDCPSKRRCAASAYQPPGCRKCSAVVPRQQTDLLLPGYRPARAGALLRGCSRARQCAAAAAVARFEIRTPGHHARSGSLPGQRRLAAGRDPLSPCELPGRQVIPGRDLGPWRPGSTGPAESRCVGAVSRAGGLRRIRTQLPRQHGLWRGISEQQCRGLRRRRNRRHRRLRPVSCQPGSS